MKLKEFSVHIVQLAALNCTSAVFAAAIGIAVLATASAFGETYFVAGTGSDKNPGSAAKPLKTIQAAAELAQPGDSIVVHEGIYRERVNPPRGGTSERKRIIYQAAPGEQVEIKGSEVIKGWSQVQDDTWQVTLPNSFFGGFNPYSDLIRGDWFDSRNREHHTGAVYVNGEWLTEAAKLEEVLKPAGQAPLWFGAVDATNTTIWAQFKGVNPNAQLVEINARQTVFYPDQPGRNFITVRGFTMRHAATPWSPPTAEQIGLIGTHWSKSWIIESNIISHSTCSGVSLGKHGDKFDNTSANSAEGYVKTIERAHAYPIPWTRENIGHHIVRNNEISHCEQAGIVGSLGCSFSTVTGNTIHDIHVRNLFSGAEQAGIKFHGAIDTEISRNHIYRTTRGLWLDWMAQGTRVTQNLFHDNGADDLFVEVDHGPFVVDNNIFLSAVNLRDWSQGGAYIHNLFAGKIKNWAEQKRYTPFHPAHSTTVAGLTNILGGDDRFFNNVFFGSSGLSGYDGAGFPLLTGGNVYCNGAQPYAKETKAVVRAGFDPQIKFDGRSLRLQWDAAFTEAKTALVTTELLGLARIPQLPYQAANGSKLEINTDYFGRERNGKNPTPGPFASPGSGAFDVVAWKSLNVRN